MGIHMFLHPRKNRSPDIVSRIFLVPVGGIFHPGESSFAEKFHNFRLLHRQQRPDDIPLDRINSAQPPEACPPEEMKQDGLCPVVRMMGHRDFSFSPAGKKLSSENPVPGDAAGLLHGKSRLLCLPGSIDIFRQEGHAGSFTELPGKLQVSVRLRTPQAVVHMHCPERESHRVLQFKQHRKQGRRIGPARKS